MPQSFLRYNDGSQNAPRLRVEHSLWSLLKLPMNADAEWSIDEKFRRVKAAGFAAVEITVSETENPELMDAFDAHGLNRVLLIQASETDEVRKQIARAAEVGTDFLWIQPANAFAPLDQVAEMIVEGTKMANDHGLSLFVETHRNNFTENLPQCLALIERVPEVRFTGDLSHLVLIGEFYGWEDERAIERLMPILERISHLHGRISNGEQVQIDVGDGSGQTAQFFVSLWAEAMRHWLKDAGPGDVLPFASELGPPRYAITLPDGSEFSDRWEQSIVMKTLAEQAWDKAQA